MPVKALFNSPTEWLIILVIVMILFGASRLPQLARALGESARELKKGMREVEKDDGAPRTAEVTEVEPDALPAETQNTQAQTGETLGRPKSRTRSR